MKLCLALPFVLATIFLAATGVAGSPTPGNISVLEQRAFWPDQVCRPSHNNFCLTYERHNRVVDISDGNFRGWKNRWGCEPVGSGDWQSGQRRTFWFRGGCAGQFKMRCANSGGNKGDDHVVDFNFNRMPDGGSMLGSRDVNLRGTCTDQQMLDPAVPGLDVIRTREAWTHFSVYCRFAAH